jgi:methenyltetrahydromethanopterin cyclohydrolase
VVDEDEEKLKEIAVKAPSSNCGDYGKTSYEIYKAVDFDFTKVDPALFAPAAITLTCAKTGATFTYGEVNEDIIKSSVED